MSGQESRLLGRWGEELAARELRARGCEILASRWRCRFGEIDLIARDGDYLCFVEVKLRKSDSFARACEFVDSKKQERLRTTASVYLNQYPTELPCRFDVVEIYAKDGVNTVRPKIYHWEDAFQ